MTIDNQNRAFISYSRVNKEFASKLAKELREGGVSIWFDQFDIPTGSRWDDEVERALRECPIFMIILTPSSIASANVKDEIGYAIDRGKRILPIFLEECDVPLRLSRFQYVDFTKKNFEEGIEDAKKLLKRFIAETSTPVSAESQAKSPATPQPVRAQKKSVATHQGKPKSQGVMIGVGVLFLLIIAFFGVRALLNDTANPPVTKEPVVVPDTKTPIVDPDPATNTPKVDIPTNTPNVDPPTNTPKVENPEPRIYNFLACETEPCTSLNSSTVFASRIETIYIHFDYENIDPGSQYTRTWTNNGEDWIKYSCAWDGPSSGSENIKLTEPTGEKGLRYGEWTVTITVNNVTLLRESINLTGNWAYWDPVPNVLNRCR